MKEIVLDIAGMHCAGCAARVEAALKSVAGVVRANVNLESEQAEVQLDHDLADPAALMKAVVVAGYGATVAEAPRSRTLRKMAVPSTGYSVAGTSPPDATPRAADLALPMASPAPAPIDPVCGMTVEPASAAGQHSYGGKTYYFCSRHCLDKFRKDPEQFLGGGQSKVGPPGPTTGKYTCPMHPEIVQEGPGACPKCGMALEPMQPSLEEGPDPELVDMQRRFWIATTLTLPVFAIAMAGLLPWPALTHALHANMRSLNWVQLVLATPVVMWCGWPFFQRAWLSLVHSSPNMFTLIAMGVGAAYAYSVLATVAPGAFPHGFQMRGGAVEPYFDSAAVIVVLVLLGQVMELRARAATGSAIRALLGLAPKTARVIRAGGHEEDVPLAEVRMGDLLRIRPGEKVPVDGVIIEGRSALDESLVTGEPIPVEKEPGSPLIGGTLNGTGGFVMRAERVGEDTMLAQIVRMVSEAQRSRAPIEKVVNQVAQFFVPAVLAVAVLAFAGWTLFGGEGRLAHALVSAVAVLIIACPCALGLATPMAIMVGTGRGARAGVLFRDAEALETLRTVDMLVVDKTGTLTEGKPKLVTIEPAEGLTEHELLQVAAALEGASEHPLAGAVVAGAKERGIGLTSARNVQSITGQGIRGEFDQRRIAIGNMVLMQDAGVEVAGLLSRSEKLRADGQTVVFVAIDGRYAGLLGVADPVKATSAAAIAQLQHEGLQVIMLTGDNPTTAQAVASRVGIEDVIAGVLPHQKSETIARLQQTGRKVAMAGDGINDAPALAKADIGIAMGMGTDVAIQSAGVTLVQGDLAGIVRALKLSRATSASIRQNLFLAFVYNAVSVPAAALGFVSPMWASAAMSLSSVSVIANSLRLRGMKF